MVDEGRMVLVAESSSGREVEVVMGVGREGGMSVWGLTGPRPGCE